MGEKFAQTKKVPTFAPANEKQRYYSEKISKVLEIKFGSLKKTTYLCTAVFAGEDFKSTALGREKKKTVL